MGKHLNMVDKGFISPYSKKTHLYYVYGFRDAFLGTIYWKNGWRQYVFEPVEYTIHSHDCLLELSQYLKQLMEDRKK